MGKIDSGTLWLGLGDGRAARTSNALAASPTFSTFTVTGAPPGQGVASIAMDPTNTDQATVVYAGFNGLVSGVSRHVFQTSNAGATWANVSGSSGGTQNLPDIPLHSVVIDPGTTPHSIIVSSDAGVARSVDGGASWQQLGVGLPTVYGSNLAIDTQATPPPLRLGTYGRSTFELTSATGPLLAVNADLAFGDVAVGQSATRPVQIFNVGSADLHVSSFQRVAGSTAFQVISGPPTPVTVLPGEHIDYTVRFAPTAPGPVIATFQINSDDPFQPAFQIPASGNGVTGKIVLAANDLQFGGVPVDDRTAPHDSAIVLEVTNQASCARCDLTITSLPITGPNAADFSLVGAPALPATIAPAGHLDLTVRFNPSADGLRTATLTVNSNDPASPSVPVSLSGTGLLPGIGALPDPVNYGPTVFDPNCGTLCGQTKDVTITNTGQAELIVDGIAFSNPVYSGPGAQVPPVRVAPNASFTEPVTFHPTATSPRAVTGSLSIQQIVAGSAIVVQKNVPLCGESVGRGIRVLVVDPAGNVYSTVDRITLQSFGLKRKVSDDVRNAALTTIDPPTSCQRIQFQYENQNLQVANSTAQNKSYYTLKVTQGNRSTTLTFGLAINEFKVLVVTV